MLILAFGAILTGAALAQEKPVDAIPQLDNAISSDPILYLLNWYTFSYERRLTDQISAKATVVYTPQLLWGLGFDGTIRLLDVQADGRFYFGSILGKIAGDVSLYNTWLARLFAPAICGPFAGVTLGMTNFSFTDFKTKSDELVNSSALAVGGGLYAGVKYPLIGKKLVLFAEPFIGYRLYGIAGWQYKDTEGNKIEKPVSFDDGYSRTGLYYGMNVGVAF
jgi:hypothetical protein